MRKEADVAFPTSAAITWHLTGVYKTQGGEADTDSVRFRSRADTA